MIAGLVGRYVLQKAGVIGVKQMTGAIVRHGLSVALKARAVDHGAAEEMVALMRSRVPQDTGRLYNGITARREGELSVVEATAVNPTGRKGGPGADYAAFVEYGTTPRQWRTVATAETFADATGAGARRGRPRTRAPRERRGHPGTAPQPFFWNSAAEVLSRRGKSLGEIANEGWQE